MERRQNSPRSISPSQQGIPHKADCVPQHHHLTAPEAKGPGIVSPFNFPTAVSAAKPGWSLAVLQGERRTRRGGGRGCPPAPRGSPGEPQQPREVVSRRPHLPSTKQRKRRGSRAMAPRQERLRSRGRAGSAPAALPEGRARGGRGPARLRPRSRPAPPAAARGRGGGSVPVGQRDGARALRIALSQPRGAAKGANSSEGMHGAVRLPPALAVTPLPPPPRGFLPRYKTLPSPFLGLNVHIERDFEEECFVDSALIAIGV